MTMDEVLNEQIEQREERSVVRGERFRIISKRTKSKKSKSESGTRKANRFFPLTFSNRGKQGLLCSLITEQHGSPVVFFGKRRNPNSVEISQFLRRGTPNKKQQRLSNCLLLLAVDRTTETVSERSS